MPDKSKLERTETPQDLLLPAATKRRTLPVWLARQGKLTSDLAGLPPDQRQWLEAIRFKGAARRHALLAGPGGSLAGAVLGTGEPAQDGRIAPAETLLGLLPAALPAGAYHLASPVADPTLAALAWGSGRLSVPALPLRQRRAAGRAPAAGRRRCGGGPQYGRSGLARSRSDQHAGQ